jgi:aminobenzoyl-glutamate transport protein
MSSMHLAVNGVAPAEEPAQKSGGLLNAVERLGNKVPHPVMMFLYLIIGVIVLSAVLSWAGVSVTEQIEVPNAVQVSPSYYEDTTAPVVEPGSAALDQSGFHLETVTVPVQSLISTEGIRFIFTSFVPNFAGFGVIAVTFIALMGAGVAEASGLMGALIRLLVAASPRRLLAFALIFVGVLSSIATDAGYLILVPLGAAAFASVGRHPLAGMAACFAGVGAIFGVNLIPGPIDAQLTAITNEVLVENGQAPLSILANYWFMIGSTFVLAAVAYFVTERIVEPRLGTFVPETTGPADGISIEDENDSVNDKSAESRGLKFAGLFALIFLGFVVLITVPDGAPLRDPTTGEIIGNTPFMDSLLFIISMTFLISGIGYGIGARTFSGSNDVIAAVTKTFAGLAGLVFMLLMIAQFIAYFNYSNLPTVLAVSLAGWLEHAGIGALPLLIGMIVVILLLDIIMPGLIPKWAIFGPIFIPLFIHLGVPPQTGLAAYRVGDSPINVVTPLMVYLPFMVTIAQRYQKNAGIGTVIALMIPYVAAIAIVWIVLFTAWFVLGLPLGPGYPVQL